MYGSSRNILHRLFNRERTGVRAPTRRYGSRARIAATVRRVVARSNQGIATRQFARSALRRSRNQVMRNVIRGGYGYMHRREG